MIVQGLRVGPDGSPLCVDNAHGVGNDVEDGFELGHAASQVFTQLLSFGDVDAGEEQATRLAGSSTPTGFGEWREGDLDEATPGARLEWDARRDNGYAVERAVDLVGEIGERVRKSVVDRALRGARDIETGELPIARVRADEFQIGVEGRERERDRLEEQLE